MNIWALLQGQTRSTPHVAVEPTATKYRFSAHQLQAVYPQSPQLHSAVKAQEKKFAHSAVAESSLHPPFHRKGSPLLWVSFISEWFNSSCSREKKRFDRWGFLTAALLWCHPFTDNNVSNLWKVTRERNTQVARFLHFLLDLFYFFVFSQSFYVNSSILQVYISWAPWQSGSVLSVMEACPFAAENRDTCHCWNCTLHSISNLPKTICHIPRRSHNNRNKLNYSPVAACHKQQNRENEILIFPRLAW